MMIVFLYRFLPKSVIAFLAKSKFTLPIKKIFLYKKYKTVTVNHEYNGIQVNFKYTAPYEMAAKAKYRGIENKIIKNLGTYVELLDSKGDGAIIDVGVNFGYLFFTWAKMFPQRPIIGFEVHPKMYPILLEGKKKNEVKNGTIINKAIDEKNGYLEFNLHFKSAKLTRANEAFKVESITIDSLNLDKVAAIKIDTDGNDYSCLLGAINTIKKYKPVIVIEVNKQKEVLQFLWANDYIILGLNQQIISQSNYDINSIELHNVFGIPSDMAHKVVGDGSIL